jgi:hypothetical protein
MPVGLGARSATLRGPMEGRPYDSMPVDAHRAGVQALGTPFSSISMKANSKGFGLCTSCSTPASR